MKVCATCEYFKEKWCYSEPEGAERSAGDPACRFHTIAIKDWSRTVTAPEGWEFVKSDDLTAAAEHAARAEGYVLTTHTSLTIDGNGKVMP